MTGVIIQHYGPRICGIVGAILFSTGLITSSFASSTTHLLITFSVISGNCTDANICLFSSNLKTQLNIRKCFPLKFKVVNYFTNENKIG